MSLEEDEQRFDNEFVHAEWADADLLKWYGAPIGGLNLNNNWTFPVGIPSIWKYPEFSTAEERSVPMTVTLSPDGTPAAVLFTMPATVATVAADGVVGPAVPPQPAVAAAEPPAPHWGSRRPVTFTELQNNFSDPDMKDAWAELNDFMSSDDQSTTTRALSNTTSHSR